jgi:uncharacterized protein YeaO (DUF488 family)
VKALRDEYDLTWFYFEGTSSHTAKCAYWLRYVCPSVRFCAWISAASTRWNFIKIYIGEFQENLLYSTVQNLVNIG